MEGFKKILEENPGSEIQKYGDFIELKLRIGQGPGCFKINGTADQVKGSVIMILQRFCNNQKCKK